MRDVPEVKFANKFDGIVVNAVHPENVAINNPVPPIVIFANNPDVIVVNNEHPLNVEKNTFQPNLVPERNI